jgi:hypothetical protein
MSERPVMTVADLLDALDSVPGDAEVGATFDSGLGYTEAWSFRFDPETKQFIIEGD